MKIPKKPENEIERLKVLRSLNLLDTPPEERFDRVTRIVKKIFNVPTALVTLIDEDRQWFKSACGFDTSETSRDISFCAYCILQSDIMIVNDTLKDDRFFDHPSVIAGSKIRFYAGYPIYTANNLCMGTLCITDSKPRKFDEKDKELLSDFGKMIQAEISTKALATVDQLTGISNRYGFIEMVNYTLKFSKRMNIPLTLFYIDLDKFKQINDSFGHIEGDLALKTVANLLLSSVRGVDIVARLGGDEFCVLCVNVSEKEVEIIKQHIANAFDKHNKERTKTYKLEYSIGHKCIDFNSGVSLETLLNEADKEMYKNKH